MSSTSSSASSSSPRRGPRIRRRWERGVARVVLVAFLAASSLPAKGQQWQDPENARFGDEVSLDNSADGLNTEFTIDADFAEIGWQDLQQPADNTLTFSFTDPNDASTVWNYIEAPHPSMLAGTVECPDCTAVFANPYGVFIGDEAVLDVGSLALVAGDIDRAEFLSTEAIEGRLDGTILNQGLIRADDRVLLLGREVANEGEIDVSTGELLVMAGRSIASEDGGHRLDLSGGRITNEGVIRAGDATLLGARIANYGEIEVADGSLLMAGAEDVWIRRFDDPISIRLPKPSLDRSAAGPAETVYAIENDGRIEAGLGHVRLSAADPLGFGIRQGSGGSIGGRRVEIAGGESGRVHLSGDVEAREDAAGSRGGEIDVTGSVIALVDARVDASGDNGGGIVHVGGEQEGRGELQRARAVAIDETSEVRADALEDGDGGRVIVFSEGLTSVDGELSARGGATGGDGGFIETSGWARIAISTTPDASAPAGEAGSWLIDPWDIRIVDNADLTCTPANGVGCLNKSIEAILDPDFDDSAFDGILRPVDSSEVDPDIIEKALAVGTDVTLSTRAFSLDPGPEAGNITVEDPIEILNADTLAGTAARFTLLAANDIIVGADIASRTGGGGGTPNLELDVVLIANDPNQSPLAGGFTYEEIRGDVVLDADIETGGGLFFAQGTAIHQTAGNVISTFGGDVTLRSGTIDAFGDPFAPLRSGLDPPIPPSDPMDPLFPNAPGYTYAPAGVTIDGIVDSSGGAGDRGGDVSMTAFGVAVSEGNVRIDVIPGLVGIATGASVTTGGGSVSLIGGVAPADDGDSVFAGNVEVRGPIDTTNGGELGGDVSIVATHIDPTGGAGFTVDFVEPDGTSSRNEGGEIDIDVSGVAGAGIQTGGGTLEIGVASTRSIAIDGTLDTSSGGPSDERGLIQILALDEEAVSDVDPISFGDGDVTIGGRADTSLQSAGLFLSARSVTTSDAVGANTVTLDVVDGTTSLELGAAREKTLSIEGSRRLDFGEGTTLRGETVTIAAATRPSDLSDVERSSTDPELAFRLGPGAAGVRVIGTDVTITTGDGTTTSTDLFSEPLDDGGAPPVPTDFGLERTARGTYEGLRLEDFANATNRPEQITIAQDADLEITNVAVTGDSQIDLVTTFGGRTIGANGMRIELESSDGILTVTSAEGLNSGAGAVPGSDDQKSFVTLRGGLLLPDSPTEPPPDPESVPVPSSVVFGDGITALMGADAFSVGSLDVSTPGDYTLDSQVSNSIASTESLRFEAGRDTGVIGAAGRGTLTVDDAVNAILLQASDELEIVGGGSGFGDLVFGAGTPQIQLYSDDITLRAGAGSDSRNTDATDRSAIVGLASPNVQIRDGGGNVFGDAASSAVSFAYRQDETIDAETDLPTLDQFGLDPMTGFRAARDVVYSVRSDRGQVDLDDENPLTDDLARFRNSALRLAGLRSGFTPSIIVSDEFAFEGDSVELGGVGDFVYTLTLANVFNRTIAADDTDLTLRSGLGGRGNLSFDRGFAPNVPVVADRIDLIAGDGADGEVGSNILVANAEFDLTGAAANGTRKEFVFQEDSETLFFTDLPTISQFVGGVSGAPDTLAIRTDAGVLEIDNPDFSALPIDTTGTDPRLVVEADALDIEQTAPNDPGNPSSRFDLDLESPNGLRLRLRANQMLLSAVFGAQDETGGRVLAGTTNPTRMGDDADFDSDTLLIEAFDPESDRATVKNLSPLSADAEGMVEFDVADGRGPTSFEIDQNGEVVLDDLPDIGSVSGQYARTLEDDEDGNPVATVYTITSRFGPIAIAPEKIDNSNALLTANSRSNETASDSAFSIAPGAYSLDDLSLITGDSIVVPEGTTIDVRNTLSMNAALILSPSTAPTDPLGSLVFELGAGPSIALSGREILLAAGPTSVLQIPDGTPLDQAVLPRADLRGLATIALPQLAGSSTDDALVAFAQSASTNDPAFSDPVEDLIRAILAGDSGAAGTDWELVEISSVQGDVEIDDLDRLAPVASDLTVQSGPDSTLVASFDVSDPFSGFDGNVLLSSIDTTLVTDNTAVQLQLNTPKLQLQANQTEADVADEDDDDRARLRSDPESLERAIVRVEQAADFDATASLPRRQQYLVLGATQNADGSITTSATEREDLRSIDIELNVMGGDTLTLDDAIRDQTFGTNLILQSEADVLISLTAPAAGFDLVDAASLQLSSLDIATNAFATDPMDVGSLPISVSITGTPSPEQTAQGFDPAEIATEGDQRFDGSELALVDSLIVEGREMTFTGDVTTGVAGTDLEVRTSGKTRFEGNLGTVSNRLDEITFLFDATSSRTATVEFGERRDDDGDGLFETVVNSDQEIQASGDVVFEADNGDQTADGRGRRVADAGFATIGKADGNLTIVSDTGDVIMSSGEKLSVGGDARIEAQQGEARLADATVAGDLYVTATAITISRRDTGGYFDGVGESQSDPGPTISANRFFFLDENLADIEPRPVGSGQDPIFGLPNPFDRVNLPSFLSAYPLFEIFPNGGGLGATDLAFIGGNPGLIEQIRTIPPTGSSRSDLSKAFGPEIVAQPGRALREPRRIATPDRLAELGVDALAPPRGIQLARLEGIAVVDDFTLDRESELVVVTESRLDARDAEAAIVLYEKLFGRDGERAPQVRRVLQDALDRYLEETRARRVVGFELRRFVKNRPSTLLEAYTTLNSLDDLFRYHRRLGLSPGEFRRIQARWLKQIQPDGITLGELSEAIHPSRYVRGSDILDIFGE